MFSKVYEQQTGRVVRFRLSFGGSGSQARAVMDGLPADIAALALPLDVMKIAEAGALAELNAKPQLQPYTLKPYMGWM
jgi:sulfate transport system substrate-binding protein